MRNEKKENEKKRANLIRARRTKQKLMDQARGVLGESMDLTFGEVLEMKRLLKKQGDRQRREPPHLN